MDAGSESGKGMYRMMSNKRITHVAGVELQKPWFDASCHIMAHLRKEFKRRRFRMPAVTIVHSCMCANIQELKYLYSITALLWMNNYVFHKIQYFAITMTNKKQPQPLVSKCTDLTTNAAFQFSENFQSVSYVAVHNPAGFNEMWNYYAFKPFEVQVTWGSTLCEVTILRHIEHLKITEHGEPVKAKGKPQKYFYSIPAPTRRELQSWDDSMTQWSNLLPTLYSAKTAAIRAQHERPLARKHNLHWAYLVSLTDLTCLPMDLMSAYTMLMNDAFSSIIAANLSCSLGTRILRKGILVGCWYVPNCHWLAVKVDLRKNYVAIADSLRNTFRHVHNEVHLKVDEMAKAAGHTQTLERYSIVVPDQGNATDCGVLTCLFMLHMAQTDITPSTRLEYESKPTAQFMRKRIFADIAAGTITPLKSN
jgi:Ulp1 protease family, C-terminal catalytic domain